MFPGPGADIIRNEEGEVLGWDYPSTDPMDLYCSDCGISHGGPCEPDYEEEETCERCGQVLPDHDENCWQDA